MHHITQVPMGSWLTAVQGAPEWEPISYTSICIFVPKRVFISINFSWHQERYEYFSQLFIHVCLDEILEHIAFPLTEAISNYKIHEHQTIRLNIGKSRGE